MKDSLIYGCCCLAVLGSVLGGCRQRVNFAPVAADAEPAASVERAPLGQLNSEIIASPVASSAVNVPQIHPDAQYVSAKQAVKADDIGLEDGDIVTLGGELMVNEGISYGQFTFSDNGGNSYQLALLPNALLEQMQEKAASGQGRFEISGEVLVYHEKVYVLVTRAIELD